MINATEQSLHRLYDACRRENWAGWDPYDGLNSRVFQALPFKQWRICRLAWIQMFKRSPINLRRLLSVPKEENPKGLALFARGLLALTRTGCKWIESGDISHVFARLERLRSLGYDEWCWGYDFDWQGRAFFLPRFQPNAVATTFAAHAFLDRYEAFGQERDIEIARSACAFLLARLRRPYESRDKVCFSYTPFDETVVHNINFLIASLLARLFAATGDMSHADWARRALAFSLACQSPDGSWPYGSAPFQKWVDHFHTCYILLALDECRRRLRTDAYDAAISRGLTFYLDRLFRTDGLPRPDTRTTHPIDIHAIALALVTLTRFADQWPLCRHRREKIVEWTLRRMQDRRGFFYYQKRAFSFVRIPYMRWSEAWMFYALTHLVAPERT